MANKTVLYPQHLAAGAKIVDFHGWEMPLNYGSQIEEHKAVREDAGMFDVSHMTVVDIEGSEAKAFLQRLLANDVAKLTQTGKALYSGMLNHDGGVIDDLICYFFSETSYRLIVNAATREKDLAWIMLQAQPFDVQVHERQEFAMIAVQGPQAKAKFAKVITEQQQAQLTGMKPFFGLQLEQLFVATTGYTGEAGYEVLVPEAQAGELWQALADAGVKPCGLAARDTLRLEAGMNLYGQEMDEQVSPLAANMGWTIAWQPETREFIGREALTAQKQAGSEKLVGVVMQTKGVLRPQMSIHFTDSDGVEHQGVLTSGTFSPTLGYAIALARVNAKIGDHAEVAIRQKRVPVTIVKPCFVRQGQSVVEL